MNLEFYLEELRCFSIILRLFKFKILFSRPNTCPKYPPSFKHQIDAYIHEI